MGIIGYELIVLGFVCIMAKAEWLLPIRKYLMLIFLTIGFGLSAFALWNIESSLGILAGFFSGGCFCLLIRVICTHNQHKEEILHIPLGSYEIEVIDRPETPTVQLSYRLVYQGKGYIISTMPPNEKPALILHAKTQKDSDIILADIAIDTTKEPISIKQKFYQIYNVLVWIAAMTLPISYKMYQDNYVAHNLMPNCMMVVLGYLTRSATRDSRSVLVRLIYWFAGFLEVVGWIIISAKLINIYSK